MSYLNKVKTLADEGKNTGPIQTPELLEFSRLNIYRMERVMKSVSLNPEFRTRLANLSGKYQWLVITEGWCGDASQIVPILSLIADAAPNISLRMVLRDEHTDLMDQYLTNGSRSIPKLIVIDEETGNEIGQWGPRPIPAQEIMIESKKHPEITHDEVVKQLQLWYSRDKGRNIEEELIRLVESWEKKIA